jgi:dipeptidyl aminopeptidase/acylaminoacyl peptidase
MEVVKKRALARASRVALIAAGGVALAYVTWGLIAAWLLVRPGRRRDYDCVPWMRYGRLEPLVLHSSDGIRLHAWVLLARNALPDDWVLVLHGYRSDRRVLQTRARFFARRGFNVLMLHFRGHGGSDPARISYGYYERRDVIAAFDFIRSLRPGRPVRIGIDGVSMGAAAAAYAVAGGEIEPAWMILESCYDNIRHALANRLARRFGDWVTPFFAWPVELVVEQLVKLRAEDLDPAKALEKVRCPVLVLAGDSEQVLKPVEIEYLYGCLPEPKRLVLFNGAGHEDFLLHAPKVFARNVGRFLRDYAPRPQPGGAAPAILDDGPAVDKLRAAKLAVEPAASAAEAPEGGGTAADAALPAPVSAPARPSG